MPKLLALSIVVIGVYAFENDIKLKGDSYTIFVNQEGDNLVADVLFKTNGMESNLQLDQINSQISVYCNRIDLLKRAEDDAKKGKNSFNKKNEHYYKTIAEFTNERVQYEVELEKLKS